VPAPAGVEQEIDKAEPPAGAVGDSVYDTREDAGMVTVTAGPPGPLAVVVLEGTMTVTESVP
jgi:hypothetical protein